MPRRSGSSSYPYSAECVEGILSEFRPISILRTLVVRVSPFVGLQPFFLAQMDQHKTGHLPDTSRSPHR